MLFILKLRKLWGWTLFFVPNEILNDSKSKKNHIFKVYMIIYVKNMIFLIHIKFWTLPQMILLVQTSNLTFWIFQIGTDGEFFQSLPDFRKFSIKILKWTFFYFAADFEISERKKIYDLIWNFRIAFFVWWLSSYFTFPSRNF